MKLWQKMVLNSFSISCYISSLHPIYTEKLKEVDKLTIPINLLFLMMIQKGTICNTVVAVVTLINKIVIQMNIKCLELAIVGKIGEEEGSWCSKGTKEGYGVELWKTIRSKWEAFNTWIIDEGLNFGRIGGMVTYHQESPSLRCFLQSLAKMNGW